MEEPRLRALRALTVLVAVCEQTAFELEADGDFEALARRVDELHELAVDAVRVRLCEGCQ